MYSELFSYGTFRDWVWGHQNRFLRDLLRSLAWARKGGQLTQNPVGWGAVFLTEATGAQPPLLNTCIGLTPDLISM